MNDKKTTSINFGGCGFTLAIIFLVLKLTHVIDWAWIWIFAPVWIPVAIALACIVIWLIVLLIGVVITAIRGY